MADVEVTFGAVDDGLAEEAEGATEQIGVIAKAVDYLAAAFKATGAAAVAAFGEMVEGAAGASASLKEMRDTGLEVRESFRGLGEALLGAFAVKELADFTKGLANTAEENQHAATTFGLTTSQIQQLRAEADGLGVSFDSFTNAMQREDRSLTTAREGSKQTGEAFKTLGLDIHKPVDNATLLQETIAALANVQDVPTRLGLAMQLFGRNIQDIAPLIGATKEQLDAINDATARSGAVSTQAQAQGEKLANAFDLQKIEMTGLANTLTVELGPGLVKLVNDVTGILEAFQKWASEGDNLNNAVKGLTVAAAALATVLGVGALSAAVEGLAALFMGIFRGAVQVATTAMGEFDVVADANPIGAVALAVEALAAAFFLLGGNAGDATAKVRDLAAADNQLATAVANMAVQTGDLTGKTKEELDAARNTAAQTEALAKAHLAAAQAALTQANAEYALDAEMGRGGASARADDKARIEGYTTAVKNATAAVNEAIAAIAKINSATPSPTPKVPDLGGGGGKGDQMEVYRTQILQMEDDVRSKTGAWLADLSQQDLDYWNGILAHATLSKASREEVEHEIAELTKKINGDAQTDKLDQDKEAIEAAKGNNAALRADWQKYVDDTVAAYTEGSRQVIKARADMAAALKAADKASADASLKALEDEAAGAQKVANDKLATEKSANAESLASLKGALEDGTISRASYWNQVETLQRNEAQQEINAINATLQAQEAAAMAELNIANLTDRQRTTALLSLVAAEGAAAQQIATINNNLNKQLVTDTDTSTKQIQAQWAATVDPMVTKFSTGLLAMAEGTKSFAQEFNALGNEMLQETLKLVDQMVSKWIVSELTKLSATNTANAAIAASNAAANNSGLEGLLVQTLQVLKADAAKVFGGVFAALAGNPATAIAAAPVASAAAASVLAYDMAEQGYDVPSGVNPLTQLHAREMVLPADIADPVRQFAQSASSGGGSLGAVGGGGPWAGAAIHVHAMDSQDVTRVLSRNGSALSKAIGEQNRRGAGVRMGLSRRGVPS